MSLGNSASFENQGNIQPKETLLKIVNPMDLKSGIDPATYYLATTEMERLDRAIQSSHHDTDSVEDMLKKYGKMTAEQAEQYANGEQLSNLTNTTIEEVGEIFQNNYLAESVIEKRKRFARPRKLLAIILSGLVAGSSAEAVHYSNREMSKLNTPISHVARQVEKQQGPTDEVIILFGALGAIFYNLSDGPKRYAQKRAQKELNKQIKSS